MAHDTHLPVTREGAVGALKLVMIVLAAMIFWQAASAVNAAFQERGLITAPPFVRGAARVLIGTETTAPFQERLRGFWQSEHRIIALGALLGATALLIMRYLCFGRVFDYMYMESDARDKRIYSGFVMSIFTALLHAGLIYGLVLLGRDQHASLTPVTLLVLFLLNLGWFGAILLAAKPSEKHSLRGLKYMAITTGAAAALLFVLTWIIEQVPPDDKWMRGSEMVLLTAGIAAVLCLVDAVIQGRTYCPRPKPVARPN